MDVLYVSIWNEIVYQINSYELWLLSGPPPSGPNSFNFMQFFWENLAKSYVGVPPEGYRPYLGEILNPPLDVL